MHNRHIQLLYAQFLVTLKRPTIILTHTHTNTATVHTNKYILIFTIVPFYLYFSNSFRTEQNRETPWTTLERIYGNKKTVPCVVSIAHTLLFTIIIDIVSRRM